MCACAQGTILGILIVIMITVVIQGGLGNQLFQFAYGRALTEKGKDVIYNVSFFSDNKKYTKRSYQLNNFLLSDFIKTETISKKQKFTTRVLNKLDVDRRVRYVKQPNDNYVADGYFTSEKYFSSIRAILLKEIVIKEPSALYLEWVKRIKNNDNAVVVHARRSDFINSGFVNLDETYYKKALSYFGSDMEIFAFSDDIDWLKRTLNRPVIQVSGQGLKDYEEMILMTKAKNFIIANSTFSWWGAWLSPYKDKKVIAPKKWFKSRFWYRANKDIVPDSWIQI